MLSRPTSHARHQPPPPRQAVHRPDTACLGYAPARHPLCAAVLAALAALASPATQAQEDRLAAEALASPYKRVIFVGDSLTDSGYFAGFAHGLFGTARTTNPDDVWASILARRLGGDADTAWIPGTKDKRGHTEGSNYAVAGARVAEQGDFPMRGIGAAIPTVTEQVDELLLRTPVLERDGLYSVWAGANDILNSLQTQQARLANPVTQPAAVQQVLADSAGAARATAKLVDRLHAAGAGTVMVFNVPDLGATPMGHAAGGGQRLMSGATEQFNTILKTELATRKGDIIALDARGLLDEAMAEPARFGLTNVTDPACTTLGFDRKPDSGRCNADTLAEPNANNTYLFADMLHPSGAAHRYLADYALSVLQAPGRMGLLAEAPLAGQRVINRAVAQRLFDRGDAKGAKVYAHYEYANDSQRNKDDAAAAWRPGMRNNLNALSLGVDYSATGQWVLGANLSHARHDATLGTRAAGRFNLNQTTVSAYTQYRFGTLAASLTGSAGVLDYDKITRHVSIGPASFRQRGNTQGTVSALTGALRYDVALGALTISPAASLSAQRITVSGFGERSGGARRATSMYYHAQSRHALISSIGVDASATYEGNGYTLKPFVGVAWEHDSRADKDRRVRAHVVDMPGSFSQLTYAPAKSATLASAGVKFSLGRHAEGSLSYHGRYGKQTSSHGAQIGLTHRF